MQIDDRTVQLAPGMAVTAEIKTANDASSNIYCDRCCVIAMTPRGNDDDDKRAERLAQALLANPRGRADQKAALIY
jgi:hypothetical protein